MKLLNSYSMYRVERPVEREKVAQETSASHGSDDKSLKKEPVRNDNKLEEMMYAHVEVVKSIRTAVVGKHR